ncbi:methyl-accepting chemotaxis protein [Heliorestis convoluta]|uniref:Methyl-accepting chemotaxis (MCP) signaling domain protein n=1 Tax=Heliorestis convoluta TaxID=356322 RepID=A0A5Q2MVN1_9FIRM|nr:HAMP domain-containing methyl-accepting chemotaxis protein [Heliorestis convoluta]QGG46274.1 methyl-accepting chemotaxis (MCP) signaling domain protein [Heliorestis convoluta]
MKPEKKIDNKNDLEKLVQTVGVDKLTKTMIGSVTNMNNVPLSIKLKITVSLVVALLISPTIAVFLDRLIQDLLASSDISVGNLSIYISTLINLSVTALIVLFLLNIIVLNPLKELREKMIRLGEGDLTVSVDFRSKDEIQALGTAFNLMVINQTELVKKVKQSAQELAAASEEMAATTQQVRYAVSEIAKSTQHVADESEEGTNSITEVSQVLIEISSLLQIAKEKAHRATEKSNETMDKAEVGKESVDKNNHQMIDIKGQMSDTEGQMKKLQEYSRQIGTITSTITNIASQTNLLALNAAIEAARAGEHGRGFAVVAEEVRKLAEQSNQGAVEVNELLQKVLVATEEAVQAAQKSRAEIDEGALLIVGAERALNDILKAVSDTVKEIDNVAKLANESVASSDQIVDLISSVATVIEDTATTAQEVAMKTQEASSSMETIAATTEEASALATELNMLVDKFKIASS